MSNDIFLKEMGAKIRALRKQNKMSLQELSKRCGNNISNLSFLEQGKINAHILTLKAIADVFNIDTKRFL